MQQDDVYLRAFVTAATDPEILTAGLSVVRST